MIGLFESVCAPWNVDGIPEDFSFGVIQPDWDRMGPYVERAMSRVPISHGDRDSHVLLRAGELHSRPVAGRRRVARTEELLRRRRHELGRDSHRRRNGPADGPLDPDWAARRRHHRLQHRQAASLPVEPRVPRHTHGRIARHGLPVPLSRQVDDHGSRRQGLADPPATAGTACLLQRRQRVGGRGLVRARKASSRRSRSCRGVDRTGSTIGRAEHEAARERRDRDGHVVHVEVHGAGPRRRPDAEPTVGQQRRRSDQASSPTPNG